MRLPPLALVALAAGAAFAAAAAGSGGGRLPPGTVRGPADLLDQYPTVGLATSAERAAAQRLLRELRRGAVGWRDPRRASSAGFATRRPHRRRGDDRVMWFHAEHRRYSNDRAYLDPRRPEVLIYADARGRPLVLVGVMFAVPRGRQGPSPGGPITRWHTHRVCVRGNRRGVAASPDGDCPRGTRPREGSEMMHVWFTRDLRSAFAIHAPVPELCAAGELPAGYCRHAAHEHR